MMNIVKKKIILLFFFFSFNQSATCQKKGDVVYFNFNRFIEDTLVTPFDFRNNYNFQTKRVYLTKYSFEEFGLLNSDTTFGYKFRVVSKVWYIYQGNQWQILFNYENCKSFCKIDIGGLKYYFKYKKQGKIKNTDVYLLELKPVGFKTNRKSIYYLNLKRGFIAVKSNNSIYLRQ